MYLDGLSKVRLQLIGRNGDQLYAVGAQTL